MPLDPPHKPAADWTPDELRAFAERCAERKAKGLMIGPGVPVDLVVEGLLALAREREGRA